MVPQREAEGVGRGSGSGPGEGRRDSLHGRSDQLPDQTDIRRERKKGGWEDAPVSGLGSWENIGITHRNSENRRKNRYCGGRW